MREVAPIRIPYITTPTLMDSTDESKRVSYDVSGITTGTTRAVVWPNKAGTIAMLSDITAPAAYGALLGDGSSLTYAITHNLGTTDVGFTLKDTTNSELVQVKAITTSTTVLTLTFVGTAPTTNQYRIVVFTLSGATGSVGSSATTADVPFL